MTRAREPRPSIPEFSSIEEEAAFWDAHDTTEFEDDFKPLKVRFAKELSTGLTVHLDAETVEKLRAEAQKKGIGPTTLARMWIQERLQQQL